MTVSPTLERLPRISRPSTTPLLRSIGTAVPHIRIGQDELIDELASLWELSRTRRERWARLCRASGIQQRYGTRPPREVFSLPTSARMDIFAEEAPPLAMEAADRAIRDAGINASDVTDLIVVSCTGFSAPGLDVALIERLGLSGNVRRTMIGYMGCFGAITGLRSAIGACAADPDACALVVCCELCSLHLREDQSMENQVATSLFGDGAAAVIVTGSPSEELNGAASGPPSLGRLALGATKLLPEGRDWMSWRITDAGFAMTLSKRVPEALEATIASFVEDHFDRIGLAGYCVHPGGPGILDAVQRGLSLPNEDALRSARTVLCQKGNMSSGTVLFVLEEAMRAGEPLPALLLAFGPGLTIEALPIRPVTAQ